MQIPESIVVIGIPYNLLVAVMAAVISYIPITNKLMNVLNRDSLF